MAPTHFINKFAIISIGLFIIKFLETSPPTQLINKFAIITIEVIYLSIRFFNYFIDKIIKDGLVILIKLSFFNPILFFRRKNNV